MKHCNNPFIELMDSVGQKLGKPKTALLYSTMSEALAGMILSEDNTKGWGLYQLKL